MPVLSKPLRLACTLVLLLCFSSCSSESQHSPSERYVLLATNIKLPYWQNAAAGLIRAAKEINVQAQLMGPDTYDPQAQRETFQRVIAENPTGILVSAADSELLKPSIDAAIARGIPVITIDSDARNSKRLLFMGTDNYRAGTMGGEIAAKNLNGKGNVVVFTIPEQDNLKERLDGYRAAFADHPQIKIIEIVDVRGDPRIAFDKTTEILEKRAAAVNAFVCLEATACPEVADVLNRKNAKDKVVVAMDTDESTLGWIQKGVIAATIGQKPFTMGYYGLKMLDDLHHNKLSSLDQNWAQDSFSPLPTFVDTGTVLVDRSNAAAFTSTPPQK